jgi:imidazole glycerol phosphate synthase glutamine amidotransferase subunit
MSTPRRRITAALVDYGAGNLASVARALSGLGYRCRISRDVETLSAADVLVLPGVGAYPAAMEALHRHRLVEVIQAQARRGQPLVGICLGMQLLANSSSEHRYTTGLGLIPGQVQPLTAARWHIGWNRVEVVGDDALLQPSDGQALYFNHSYVFHAPAEYTVAVSRLGQGGGAGDAFTAAVRRGNIVGLQFHPEKSQIAGRELLKNLIEGLVP